MLLVRFWVCCYLFAVYFSVYWHFPWQIGLQMLGAPSLFFLLNFLLSFSWNTLDLLEEGYLLIQIFKSI